jgi:hypothetical protein
MSVRLSCPSCNTPFLLAAPPAGRATCPRCGDVFPVRPGAAEEAGDGEPQAAPYRPPERRRGARRTAAAAALAILGLAAGLGFYFTRGPKPNPDPPAPPPEHPVTPPAQLVGPGYLPAECNVAFAVQPGPLLEYASRTGQEPRALLAKAGVPDPVLGVLERVGISPAQIDHLAGGTSVGGAIDLRATLVLVLKRPLANEDEFRTRLKAKPATGKQKYESVALAGLPALMARVSPTVWVFGLGEGDFSAVQKGGFGPGGVQFRGSDADGLRDVLAALPPDAAVWVAADDDRDWTQKPLVKLLAASGEAKKAVPNLGALGDGRGVALALAFGDRPRMEVLVRTAETATAERVRAYFRARAAEADAATAGGGGTRARYDGPFDPAALRRFLTDAAK